MPKSKTMSPSDDSTSEPRDVRKRTVKACQRCRLKKCKCDGSTPCVRCKSDDAICSYGRHKKSDKIVFRKGYVQMLERQHSQLIAGLQEMYRLTSTGQPWPSRPLDCTRQGQPLTHKILEGLGVLGTDEWDDPAEYLAPGWESFEQMDHGRGGAIYHDSMSEGTLPSPTANTARFSPTSCSETMQPAFPESTIMMNRRKNRFGNPVMPISQATTIKGLNGTAATLPGQSHHRTGSTNNGNTVIKPNLSLGVNQPRCLVKTEDGYLNGTVNREPAFPISPTTSSVYDSMLYSFSHDQLPQVNSNFQQQNGLNNMSFGNPDLMTDIFDPFTTLGGPQQQELPPMQQVQ